MRMNSFDRFDAQNRSYGNYLRTKMMNFASNSTQIITDLNSAIANSPWSTQSQTAQLAAGGPITDLLGVLRSIVLNFQEAAEKLAYILNGSMIQGSLTAPGGVAGSNPLITTANDSATYNLLVGVYQIIK